MPRPTGTKQKLQELNASFREVEVALENRVFREFADRDEIHLQLSKVEADLQLAIGRGTKDKVNDIANKLEGVLTILNDPALDNPEVQRFINLVKKLKKDIAALRGSRELSVAGKYIVAHLSPFEFDDATNASLATACSLDYARCEAREFEEFQTAFTDFQTWERSQSQRRTWSEFIFSRFSSVGDTLPAQIPDSVEEKLELLDKFDERLTATMRRLTQKVNRFADSLADSNALRVEADNQLRTCTDDVNESDRLERIITALDLEIEAKLVAQAEVVNQKNLIQGYRNNVELAKRNINKIEIYKKLKKLSTKFVEDYLDLRIPVAAGALAEKKLVIEERIREISTVQAELA